jgi:hypothetical protein
METPVKGRQFTTTAAAASRGSVLIPIPFNPDTEWGTKPRHHIHGTVNGMGVRGVVEPTGEGYGFTLGPAWLRGCGLAAGDRVTVHIGPEGPQRDDLADDVAAALRPILRPPRSSTRSPSSTAAPIYVGSTPPNAVPSNAPNASLRWSDCWRLGTNNARARSMTTPS